MCVLQHWAQGVQRLEEEIPKNKNKAEGRNAFPAANLQASEAHSPLPPHPQGQTDQLLQDLQELILPMTDTTQASKTLGKNSSVYTHLK